MISVVITGEVDHGKSSLVGRTLEECGAIPDSRIEAVKAICREQHREYEPAFLLDALLEEQSQGITLDLAQVQFERAGRTYRFIDSPGHRDFLKNMVTGSSAADVAILLVDASEGVREQTRRHCYLLKLFGVASVLVVVNKMDLVKFDEARFLAIEAEVRGFLGQLGLPLCAIIPISAKYADNFSKPSPRLPWFKGLPFLDALAAIPIPEALGLALRFSVQGVYKFDERRLVAGRVDCGTISVGSELKTWPHGRRARVASIERWNAPASSTASAPESIAITLAEQCFLERGEILSLASEEMRLAARFTATLFWMGEVPLTEGLPLRMKLLTQEQDCQVEGFLAQIDPVTYEETTVALSGVERHSAVRAVLCLAHPIAYDHYSESRVSGRFVLLKAGLICGGGIIVGEAPALQAQAGVPSRKLAVPVKRSSASEAPLRSFLKAASWRLGGLLTTVAVVKIFTGNTKAAVEVGALEAFLKIFLFFAHERLWNKIPLGRSFPEPVVIWLTGLPCAGKTTLAEKICEELRAMGHQVEHLDGDAVRKIFPQSGFSREDRNQHIERVGFLAGKLAENGVFVVASFVSPYRESRNFVRKLCPRFVEVYVSTSLAVCEKRDVKGMYAKARRKEIRNFTGIDDPYEPPENPELQIDAGTLPLDEAVHRIKDYLIATQPNLNPGKI